MKNKKILGNTMILMIFQVAKILFPFITLPYLTRVLTTETYGCVSYVKTTMTYMQLFVDFGFVLSATKDIVKVRDDQDKVGLIVGDTLLARCLLGFAGFIVLFILIQLLPILKANALYTVLSYITVFLSIFLMDFLFRGLEKMHVITIRFFVMKIISTLLTFVLIKNDGNMILIPILDIISSLVAVVLVAIEIKKLNIKMRISKISNAIKLIKESFVYFLSGVASTSFNALSTIIIGIYISTTEVAYWGLCMQIIGPIQACYNPIADAIYPEMIKNKSWSLINKIIKIFLPLVIAGCIFVYFIANFVFLVLGGEEYLVAVPIFRLLIPALFFGFFAILYGWPTLGAIGKTKETTISTTVSCIIYVASLVALVVTDSFTLTSVAIVRVCADITLFAVRYYYCLKYKHLFLD